MEKLQENVSLLPYNTFHFDCIARYFIEISKISELDELMKTRVFAENKRLILGGGANILLTKKTFDGLVIKNNILGKEIYPDTSGSEEDETSVTIKVGGGENRNNFVRRAIDQGYCGVENLVSIPGSVGASPMQNIGAYGVEVKSIIANVDCVKIVPPVNEIGSTEQHEDLGGNGSQISNLKSQVFFLTNAQCKFSYRDSVFKQELKDKVFITHVTFKLQKYNPETYKPNISYRSIQEKLAENKKTGQHGILSSHEKPTKPPLINEDLEGFITPKTIAQTISEIRSSKLPDRHKIGTAGSFFKNPIIPETQFQELKKKFSNLHGYPIHQTPSNISSNFIKLNAGQLIDLTGLKGLDQEHVGVYKKHALVLIHHGGGTGDEIQKLATYIQSTVYEKFGVQLEPEVNYV